jgi:hypothetical protein
MYSQNQILDFLKTQKPFLANNYRVSKLGVFGSYAKGTQTVDSDIDIILEFEEGTENLLEKRLLLEAFFQSNLGLKVDIARERFLRQSVRDKILNHAIFV